MVQNVGYLVSAVRVGETRYDCSICLMAYESARTLKRTQGRVAKYAIYGSSHGTCLLEPDLGTSLVFLVIMLSMLFVAGANRKVFYGFCLFLLAAIVLIYVSLYIYTDGFTKLLEEDIPFLPLKSYQLMRLAIFINPEMDPQTVASTLFKV